MSAMKGDGWHSSNTAACDRDVGPRGRRLGGRERAATAGHRGAYDRRPHAKLPGIIRDLLELEDFAAGDEAEVPFEVVAHMHEKACGSGAAARERLRRLTRNPATPPYLCGDAPASCVPQIEALPPAADQRRRRPAHRHGGEGLYDCPAGAPRDAAALAARGSPDDGRGRRGRPDAAASPGAIPSITSSTSTIRDARLRTRLLQVECLIPALCC